MKLAINYQLAQVIDKATDAIPSMPTDVWTTPILIDNYNKQVTIYSVNANHYGFTMRFDLVITVPKGLIASRKYYSFYVTFMD
jgi:hypothetical protein